MPEPSGVSLVVPVYNERESLAELHAQVQSMARASGLTVELIFVDDGSRDGSWEEISRLAQSDPTVIGLRFRRNFGKAAALQAGFSVVRFDRVVTLDADLQDDPAEVPNFLRALDSGNDLVSGWKKIRHDPVHKVFPSRVFNAMVSRLTRVKLHDHNCGMKAYRRDVVREVRLYGEMHRFVPVLAAARGYRVGELVIHHRPRQFGKSKYGFRRYLRGFLDLLTVTYLTRYGRRPMHLFGPYSLCLKFVGGVIIVCGLIWPTAISPLVLLGVAFLLASGMVYLHGLQAEVAASLRTDDPYSISERVGGQPTQ